jgi:hypothetical protein
MDNDGKVKRVQSLLLFWRRKKNNSFNFAKKQETRFHRQVIDTTGCSKTARIQRTRSLETVVFVFPCSCSNLKEKMRPKSPIAS